MLPAKNCESIEKVLHAKNCESIEKVSHAKNCALSAKNCESIEKCFTLRTVLFLLRTVNL